MQAFNSNRMTYLVTLAHLGGDFMPERNVSDLDRASTVNDIANGQLEGLVSVLECNPAEGICHDVTEDIAQEVMTIWSNEGETLHDWQVEFIEVHVGLHAAASFKRAA
jgi:hypothetical protein